VESRRQITEEDILMTEEMIGRSFVRLKRSVVLAPSRAFSSAGDTVRKHPVAAAVAAVGAGIAVYGLFRLMTRRSATREKVPVRRERESRPDMSREILSMLIPIVTPYVIGYLKNYMDGIFSGKRD
jgi:O-antigen/teichoic acid export membrane protein